MEILKITYTTKEKIGKTTKKITQKRFQKKDRSGPCLYDFTKSIISEIINTTINIGIK